MHIVRGWGRPAVRIVAAASLVAISFAVLYFGVNRLAMTKTAVQNDYSTFGWFVAETNITLLQFLASLSAYQADPHSMPIDEVLQRFDIFWSRIPVLTMNEANDLLPHRERIFALARKIETELPELEAHLGEALAGSQDAKRTLDRRLEARSRELQLLLQETLTSESRRATEEVVSAAKKDAFFYLGLAATVSILLALVFLAELKRSRQLLDRAHTAEVDARQAQQRLEDAIEALPLAFTLTDIEGRVVAINAKYREFYPSIADLARPGVSLADLVQKSAANELEAPKGEDLEDWVRLRLAHIEQGRGRFEHQMRDGRVLLIDDRKTSEGGTVTVRTDITDLKRREADFAGLAAELKLIMDNVQDPILQLSQSGAVKLWNRAAARMFEWDDAPQDRDLRRWIVAIPGGATTAELEPMDFLTLCQREGYVECVAMTAADREFPAELYVDRVRHEDRDVYVVVVHDLTRRKEVEERLRRSQTMEALGQLTGGVAHDFNNVLNVMAGNAELLLAVLEHDDDLREAAERIRRAAARGTALTKRLLAFARSTPLQSEALQLAGFLSEFGLLLSMALDERHKITLDIEDSELTVEADPSELETALLNLVFNARDAMPDGGGITVRTRQADANELPETLASPAGSYIIVEVEDDGPGMPPEVAERAFEPFFTTKPTGKGTGLGLSSVYGFAEQSAGTVELFSRPAAGTTVRLYLPAANPSTALPPLAEPDVTAPLADLEGATVLVVEDDADVLSTTRSALTSLRAMVLTACNVAEAKAVLLRDGRTIDTVVTDVVMPGGESGLDLARWIRTNLPFVGVVAVTGYARDVIAQQSDHEIPCRLLAKPFARDELLNALHETHRRNDKLAKAAVL